MWLDSILWTTMNSSKKANSNQAKVIYRSLPVKAGGSHFELIAIVTDVEQNVTEGSDGIEHM